MNLEQYVSAPKKGNIPKEKIEKAVKKIRSKSVDGGMLAEVHG